MFEDLIGYLLDGDARDRVQMVAMTASVIGVVVMLSRSIRRMRRRKHAARDRRLTHLRGH